MVEAPLGGESTDAAGASQGQPSNKKIAAAQNGLYVALTRVIGSQGSLLVQAGPASSPSDPVSIVTRDGTLPLESNLFSDEGWKITNTDGVYSASHGSTGLTVNIVVQKRPCDLRSASGNQCGY